MGVIRYALLGGLDVANGAGPVSLGTRKQRAVLAQLVLSGGQVVGMGRLIEGHLGRGTTRARGGGRAIAHLGVA